MYTFDFTYQDGSNKYFEHIKEVQYVRNANVTVYEKDIQKHLFPTGYDLHLFSDDLNVTVSGKNLLYIEVKKEN
ncbi:MAG: hypothetical protein K2I96_04945 [Lachnospiraceae bacterium]|nr:hypothetical protein [Lachnospiraceae bacterium]